jgi:hypothetical protein
MHGLTSDPAVHLFQTTKDLAELHQLANAAADGSARTLPVYTADRPDLGAAAEVAERLYDRIHQPEPADIGILLAVDDPVLDAAAALWRPLAREWIVWRDGEPHRPAPGGGAIARRIVVLAPFDALRSDAIMSLLLDAYLARHGSAVGFITGRDSASMLWHAAKQWCGVRPGDHAVGVFTDGEKSSEDARIVGHDRFDDFDVKATIDGRSWRRLLVRGHARDDNLNLGDYTMCGRNLAIGDDAADVLRPRCGYGAPCFKDESKLMPMNRLAAVEIVLAGCNAGPMADFALYDDKYQLHLAGIDGAARSVVSVMNYVHASGERENEAFLALGDEDDTATVLNASLKQQSTTPTFWTFGMPGRPADTRAPEERPPPRMTALVETLDLLRALGEPGANHALARQIAGLSQIVDAGLSRNQRFSLQRLWAMSFDLDRKIIEAVVADPDDDFAHLADVVLKRSVVADGAVLRGPCCCGRPGISGTPVERFERDLLARTRPSLLATICQRCVEESFRFPQGVALVVPDELSASPGATMKVEVQLGARLEGDTFVTLVFPRYLQDTVALTPKFHRAGPDRDTVVFQVRFSESAIAQAYHFTGFAVRDLSVSTYRKNFKMFPTPAPANQDR